MTEHPEIERLLRHSPRKNVLEETHAFLTREPESAPLLVTRLMEVGDTYQWHLLAAAMGHLRPDDYPHLLTQAIGLLKEGEFPNAYEFVTNAYLRHGISLRPYLKELFLTENYSKHSHGWTAWRTGGAEHVSFLAEFLDNPDLRERALCALLELRLPDAFACIPPETDSRFFHNVGFSREPDGFRQLYSDQIYHLQFPRDYAANWLGDDWVPDDTWQELADRPYRFGGELTGQHCAICGGTLHHLLTFPAAALLPATCSLPSLTIATCNHCIGWEPRVLTLHHDEQGIPQSHAPASPAAPEFYYAPFEETTVALTPTPERYRWQEWTHDENIHRVGGHPAWIQEPEFPECPGCQRTMTFLLQLNSRLPFVWPNPEKLEVMEWGSGGIAYFFWCDSCRISAGTWQCT